MRLTGQGANHRRAGHARRTDNAPEKVRLYEGEIKVDRRGGLPAGIARARAKKRSEVEGQAASLRVEKEQTRARVEQEPKWLKGFQGAEVQESIGSLVANVDGRNVPLTVGYHKVTVEIRDQIARTTVEESFANLTDGRLEGVFYFPLPQDASISGFGMWIGNELVEADIVEKQRAREIYEEILREKPRPRPVGMVGREPVQGPRLPHRANAEKRIRIVYTQVLPLRGNAFRYSYALQSEMLKQHPLRELSIDVKINSAVPLKKVASPTHTVRTAADRALGARGIRGPGIYADPRFRGGCRAGRKANGAYAHSASPRRRRLLHADVRPAIPGGRGSCRAGWGANY